MRKHWGWGNDDVALTPEQTAAAAPAIIDHLGFGSLDVEAPVALDRARLPAPRIAVALPELSSADPHVRATHTLGKAYRDIIRGFRGDFTNAPDFVVFPRDESDVQRTLEWAQGHNVAVIPYGGGTSVVGGIEPRGLDGYEGVISLDMSRMHAVLEVDPVSRSALVEAGAAGPAGRGSTARARVHHPLLPTVVRVLDGGGLDRDPSGRTLRQWSHPHR